MRQRPRPDRAAQGRSAGFTLIEVLIAVFLLTVILGAVYTAFFVIHDAATTTGDMVVRLQEARATMDLMRREIEAAMPQKDNIVHPIDIKDRDVFGNPASVLTFDTFASPLPGGARIMYSVSEAEDGTLSLLKRIGRVGQDMELPGEAAAEVEAVDDIVSFLVEARLRDKWERTWREARTPPEEIRVTLTVMLHGAEVPLVFTTRPYAGKSL